MKLVLLIITILWIAPWTGKSQTRLPEHKNIIMHVGILPGISNAGIKPELTIDQISLFLLSGYSAGTEGFGFASIQNLNTSFSRGLFLAGLSNMTGINNKKTMLEGLETTEANLEGAQISGFLNFVLDNSYGAQISGAFNITKGGFFGLQLAGLGNTVGKYTFGTQLAGLFNISPTSVSGVQISTLYNATKGRLEGLQIGAINKAYSMHGKNSDEVSGPWGLQIGLFNKTSIMNGFQIGLVNIGRKMKGTQIGLININGRGEGARTRDGTSIGLLNLGTAAYLASMIDHELYLNYELGTGTSKNGRMQENKNKYFYSTVTYAKRPLLSFREAWRVGFGIMKLWAPRSISMGEYYFISTGVQIFHDNPQLEFIDTFNPLIRLRTAYGKKLGKLSMYGFIALLGDIAFNDYQAQGEGDYTLNPNLQIKPGVQGGIFIR